MNATRLHAALAVRAATVLVVWAAWEALARSGLVYEGIVPSSLAVASSMMSQLMGPAIYLDAVQTACEVIAGFALGAASGIGMGLLLGARRFADRAAAPYLQGLAATPKIVFLPILMLMLGVGAGSKIGMGALSAFFPVAIATAEGMREIDPVLPRVARSFNASAWQTTRMVLLPALAEPVIVGMRLGLGVTIVGVLLAEIKFAKAGLGHLAIQHYNFLRVADMYAVLLITFALALAANALMGAVGRRLLRRRR